MEFFAKFQVEISFIISSSGITFNFKRDVISKSLFMAAVSNMILSLSPSLN